MQQNQSLFNELRFHHPVFHFDDYQFQIKDNQIDMQFFFRIGEKNRFAPKMKLSLGKYSSHALQKAQIKGLVFHIGMIELISYWKCTCSPTVIVHPYHLTKAQQIWWKKLYWKGLGEFFYQNGIT